MIGEQKASVVISSWSNHEMNGLNRPIVPETDQLVEDFSFDLGNQNCN